MNIEEKLLAIKEQIESAKKDKATYEGKLTVQMERLKELGCKSVAEAEKKIEKLKKEIISLNNEIETEMKDFEETYGF